MNNPILVEILRANRVESQHRGAAAVCDADGALVFSLGDIDRPIYPRSAIKAFQALPLVESGAADSFGLSPQEIALACASHSGEPAHVAAAASMLAKAGCSPNVLECGVHWPLSETAGRALAANGQTPSALHNNCSGKHGGFICVSCHAGVSPRGYIQGDHIAQREAKAAIEALTGARLDAQVEGVDGCGIPAFAMPLRAIAHGFARFGAGRRMSAARASACQRIRAAVAAHPEMVAGARQFDTQIMQRLGARCFVKLGAEGVHCAALPELGLGLAVKADDGASRAARLIIAALIARFGNFAAEEAAWLQSFIAPPLANWVGVPVGAMRFTAPR